MNENTDQQYVLLYLQVHQPRRLNAINFFDLPKEPRLFDDALNESIVKRVAENCYIPANKLLLECIRKFPGIRVVFSLSGIVMEQLESYAPEALEGFRALAQTGSVEFLSETYYHSLAGLLSPTEFEEQVLQHMGKTFELFGVRPTVFRNTELIYNDAIGKRVADLGFSAVFAEGHENVLKGKNAHVLYCHPEEKHLKIFLRNYRLSDDIAFRFMEGGVRLDAGRYLSWLDGIPPQEKLITLGMDYETFGEHQRAQSGICDFLADLLKSLATSERYRMVTPSEVIRLLKGDVPLSVDQYSSWADQERDLSAWLGNDMQRDAFNSLMKLGSELRHPGHEDLLRAWRFLQTSDHFYYMSLKTDSDGSVHAYFSPFPSSYEAFINFMNAVNHLATANRRRTKKPVQDEHDLASREAERQQVSASTPVWVRNIEPVPQASGNTSDP